MIGGAEDRTGDRLILREVLKKIRHGRLAIVTAASEQPDEMWKSYQNACREMDFNDIEHVQVLQRQDAFDSKNIKLIARCQGVFFTGGDQLKITTKIGGTPVGQIIQEIHEDGGLLAGTSAGASVMGETMLIAGEGGESHKVGGALSMAPGLGFVHDMIIDQHFAQRGRMGRLLGAVAQNPKLLGMGIDEDTAVVIEGDRLRCVGAGAVYIADGREVSFTNISEGGQDLTMCMYDVRLHILANGSEFDLKIHRPIVQRKQSRASEPEQVLGNPKTDYAEVRLQTYH
jgi:cyanophycinase